MQEKKSINFQQFMRKFNQNIFFNSLSDYEGSIAIVWDGTMTTQFDTVLTPKLLLERNLKNYKLEHSLYADAKNVVYLLYPTHNSVTKLVRNWLEKLPNDDLRLHHVFFLPNATFTLRQQLREGQRVRERIQSVGALPLHWFPTEQPKLITMGLPQLVAQLVVNGDWNYLFRCAEAVRQLEMLAGGTLNIHCKGEWSARVADMLRKLRTDPMDGMLVQMDSEQLQSVTDIVIVDRWIDPVTPMLRQFTFGGANDEFLSIDSKGILRVPLADFEEKEPLDEGENSYKELKLYDQIYEKLQDLHVNKVANKIRELVNELKEQEQQRESLASLAEFKNFISKLPNIVEKKKSTGNFTKLAGVIQRYLTDDFFQDILHCEQELIRNPQPDKVIPFIENSIIESKDKVPIVRLIVLQSLYSKGLKSSVMQHYAKLICQSYGISELKWILKLQLAGLVRDEVHQPEVRYPAAANFGQLAARRYRTNFAEIDELKRFGSNCGTSLLIRLIEEGLGNNWSEFTSIEGKGHNRQNAQTGTTLVFVVGGVTRSEVSMLNQLPANLLYCTTGLVSGNDLLNSFRE